MRIRHLRIRVNTDKGLHGTDIAFPDGLVVLWAENSMGKSTCIKSIMVVLGLEAMLGVSQQDLPLTPAMKSELSSDSGLARVLESDIYLEIENSSGTRIVVHRTVKGTRNKDLITVVFGPALSEPRDGYHSEDFFVTRSGAATRERGFHYFLAKFLGWELPFVQTYDGSECPLYLQCIFPYVIVEQTRGWSSIDPPIPTQFRIRDPHRRVLEFLLNLDAYHNSKRRIELSKETLKIESNWALVVQKIQVVARSVGGITNNVPVRPVTVWPPEIDPGLFLPSGEQWLLAESVLKEKLERLGELSKAEIPTVGDCVATAELELSVLQRTINEKEAILARIQETLEIEKGESSAVLDRLDKIGQDIRRNKDVKTIQSLGSTSAPSVTSDLCPTCHQRIEDSLAPLAEHQSVMSIEENIAFLEEQEATFRAIQRNIEATLEAREMQIFRLRGEIAEGRSQIRALKQTLISDPRMLSRAAIKTQIELQQQVEQIGAAQEDFESGLSELGQLSESWAALQAKKTLLPREDTTNDDREKIETWSGLFREQLHTYDFRSLQSGAIGISLDTYRPTHEGFQLPMNISASDFIRVIWAYLNGLLELSRNTTTNHPGLLIFDEPKQQSAKDLSFKELLVRVSRSVAWGQQVVFATSENPEALAEMLSGIPHTYIGFEGRTLSPIEKQPSRDR